MKKMLQLILISALFTKANANINNNELNEAIHRSFKKVFKTELVFKSKKEIRRFDFIDNNQIIFSGMTGDLKLFNIKENRVISISGMPEIDNRDQGGLFDLRVSPFEKNKVYFTYSEKKDGLTSLVLASGEVRNGNLESFKKVFMAQPSVSILKQFGGAIEFDEDKYIYLGVGDRRHLKEVLDMNTHLGKVLRLSLNGEAPKDNPFYNVKNHKKEIWSYGHRNIISLSFNKIDQNLYSIEYGPKCGAPNSEEINNILPKTDYGWPSVIYGEKGAIYQSDYTKSKAPISSGCPSVLPTTLYTPKNSSFTDLNGKFLKNSTGMVEFQDEYEPSKNHNESTVSLINLKGPSYSRYSELMSSTNFKFLHIRGDYNDVIYVSTDQGHLFKIVPLKP